MKAAVLGPIALALTAALAAAVPVWAFYPGLLDADGLALYAAALLGAPVPDWHSPLLAFGWRALIVLGAGPAVPAALQSAGWFAAFATVLWLRRVPLRLALPAPFAVLALPPLLPWLASVEKTSFAGVMLAGCFAALLAAERDRRALLLLAPLTLCGWLARPNGAVLFLPLAVFAGLRFGGRARAGAVLVVALALAAPPLGRDAGLVAPAHPEQATMDLDLFNLSLRAGKDLFPPGVLAESLESAEARLSVPPWNSLGLGSFSILPLEQSLVFQPDGPDMAALCRAWVDAILSHPADWLRYRLAFARAFTCVDFSAPCPFGWHWNNGGIDPNPFGLAPSPNATVFAFWLGLLDNWTFRPGVLAGLVVLVLVLALPRRRPASAAVAAALLLLFASNLVLAPGPTPRHSVPLGLLLPLLAVDVIMPTGRQGRMICR
jgi:hypothetical protein